LQRNNILRSTNTLFGSWLNKDALASNGSGQGAYREAAWRDLGHWLSPWLNRSLMFRYVYDRFVSSQLMMVIFLPCFLASKLWSFLEELQKQVDEHITFST